MNPTGKKFISLFLVFSIMMLSVNLYAKERRGAKLEITKKDGRWIEGELITVKPNSLLLLNNEGKDVSVGVANIKVIKIVKKSKFIKSVKNGLLIGASIGFVVFGLPGTFDKSGLGGPEWLLLGPLFGAIYGVTIGGIVGVSSSKYKFIQIEGMTDQEIQKVLDKLRKKARVRDYK